VDPDGMVQARYSNGKTIAAAQIALADFRNVQGLVPVGGNLWRATPASGQAAMSAPGTANLGMLKGGALEESNIDLTQQLVDMITAQRAYQANAQTIKTQDQMMSTLVNLR
jgi:flagellar hook protein FlgE